MVTFKYGGFSGKILRVNLSKRKITEEELKQELVEQFLGGRGLGARMLFEEVGANIDPLEPDNKLIFATGPLNGTKVPSCSRYAVVTKSPLTGLFLESLAAGFLAPHLKFAGYDAIIVEGKSEKPVYLWITNGKVELRDASWLWRMLTDDTQRLLKKETDER